MALQSPSPPSVAPQGKRPTRQLPFPESEQDYTGIHSSLHFLKLPVEVSINQLAQHFTKLAGLTHDSIIDRYFEAFHKWLPVVSPDSLRQEVSWYREEGRLLLADFIVLLLAMLQIVLPSMDPILRPPSATQELLYRVTKSAFSQAQASIGTSLRLVQAGLLIALREYICVRPEAAYVSVMTCVGLARMAGIETALARTKEDSQEISDSRLEEMERENVAWAIPMLERYV